ncbi:MAG: LacI family DNA-binding transcriptional regulator [Verrucomicrobiota bacterium]|nr:LacI family DNA-binding transcriptional regulator [Verrucomicrobiota bacterium]
MRISTDSSTPDEPITQEAIAARCGVSLSAVSLALMGKGRLGLGTRTRILEAAQALGYVPSRAAQQMANRRWAGRSGVGEGLNLAWLYSSVATAYISAAERERHVFLALCKPHGHGATAINIASYHRPETWWEQLRARGVEGILLGPGITTDSVDIAAVSAVWPTVAYYSLAYGGHCHEVLEDNAGRIMRAVRWMREFGYRRVGFVMLEHEPPLDDDYIRRGALHYMPERFPEMSFCPPLFYLPQHYGKIQLQVSKWYKQHRPEVVVGMNEAIYHSLKDTGVKIPDEVGFLNFNLPDAYDHNPRLPLQLSGFLRERTRLLASAIHLLEGLIARPPQPDSPPVRLLIEAAPVVGQSLRHRSASEHNPL